MHQSHIYVVCTNGNHDHGLSDSFAGALTHLYHTGFAMQLLHVDSIKHTTMRRHFCLLFFVSVICCSATAQDSVHDALQLKIPLLDLPQNSKLPYKYPSMDQALEWSNDFYELAYWGIDVVGDKMFLSKKRPATKFSHAANHVFKYAAGLAFSKYASELPVPLGVWGHEEFHRSVLGVAGYQSKNGNWLFNRWDGTVYGLSDDDLSQLKSNNINQLLYSYVAGVQYEIALNKKTTLHEFYNKRSLEKKSLMLYNAWYVYDYFHFASSRKSDSAKKISTSHESLNPAERDFAGSDLTAWAYDMFNPTLPFISRDSFPGGGGINRRVGFSDLSLRAQDYLVKQKKLSLLNFLNPSMFFINSFDVSDDLSFNFFTQYAPTHFGNDIAAYFPVRYKKYDMLLNVHRYHNYESSGLGIGLGLHNFQLTDKWQTGIALTFWNQPENFFDNHMIKGGSIDLDSRYNFTQRLSAYVSISGKTKGWSLGNPYLDKNISVQLGLGFRLPKK